MAKVACKLIKWPYLLNGLEVAQMLHLLNGLVSSFLAGFQRAHNQLVSSPAHLGTCANAMKGHSQ